MNFEEVEKNRKTYKNVLLRRILIAAVVVIPVSLLGIGLFAFSIVFAIAIIALSTRKNRENYHKAYKGYFVSKSLEKVFANLVYEREKGINPALLASTGMINTGDRYYTNDYVHGEYKDVAFSQADVHIMVENRDSDGNKTYSTIFKGRFMIFDFPKKFTFRLEIAEKGFRANLIPGTSKNGRKIEKISLESGEFNEKFKTYAEDGFEAFYILDPSIINNILELEKKYKGKLLFCFLDNRLIVGLKDNKDAFEPPSVFKPIDEKTEIDKVAGEICLITDFIGQLKLNRKIFE